MASAAIIGLALLALLALGLLNRKKEKKQWLEEERYDESGRWIDKRAGERGTYGSLDEEMEANRRHIARQSKVSELARLAQQFCFEHEQGAQQWGEQQVKEHLRYCKSEANSLLQAAENLANRDKPLHTTAAAPSGERAELLKKKVLNYVYDTYPVLLDAEIEGLKLLDRAAADFAAKVLNKAENSAVLKK